MIETGTSMIVLPPDGQYVETPATLALITEAFERLGASRTGSQRISEPRFIGARPIEDRALAPAGSLAAEYTADFAVD